MSKQSSLTLRFPYEFDPAERRLKIHLSVRVYPLQAVMGAAYTFIDRAYVFLDGNPKGELTVFLRSKKPADAAQAEALVGEFENELLSHALRLKVAAQTRKIRESIVTAALFSSVPREKVGVDDKEIETLLKESEAADYSADPFGIAVPWEVKYGKKKAEKRSPPPAPASGPEGAK